MMTGTLGAHRDFMGLNGLQQTWKTANTRNLQTVPRIFVFATRLEFLKRFAFDLSHQRKAKRFIRRADIRWYIGFRRTTLPHGLGHGRIGPVRAAGGAAYIRAKLSGQISGLGGWFGANHRIGAVTTRSRSPLSHAPHQEKVELAITL